MTLDISTPTAPAGSDTPAASLTMVRVKRRRSKLEPTGKRGDLTQRLTAAPEAPTVEPPAEPFLDLPEPQEAAAPEARAIPETVETPSDTDVILLPPAPETEPVISEAALSSPPAPLPEIVVEYPEIEMPELAAEPAPPEPAPTPAIDTTVAEEAHDAPPQEGPRAADEIIDYWDSLRGGRDVPSLDELDRQLVASGWPNSVLLAFSAANPEMPGISRLGDPDGEIEYTAMVTDWILSRGRQSAKRGQPMEEEQRFPVSTGSARYRLLLLPFSSYGLKSDHVLCHVSRAEEQAAVASIKRWLAF